MCLGRNDKSQSTKLIMSTMNFSWNGTGIRSRGMFGEITFSPAATDAKCITFCQQKAWRGSPLHIVLRSPLASVRMSVAVSVASLVSQLHIFLSVQSGLPNYVPG